MTTVMVLLTAAYCGLLWLAIGAYQAWLPATLGAMPALTSLLVCLGVPFPWHAAPWQTLALASMLRALYSARQSAEGVARLRAWLIHVGWLLLSVFAIGVGMLLPIVQIAAILHGSDGNG